MAFVFSSPDFGEVPSSHAQDTMTFPVGYDDSGEKSYSLMLGFSPAPPGISEFFFCLVEADHTTNSEHQYWDGLDVAKFINSHDRRRIRTILEIATEHLLSQTKPKDVFCCTYGANLPEKAILKYLDVANRFRMCGYKITELEPYMGKRSWKMELSD